ncbi:MAG TPA: amidohydrolase family protein [Bryobacteraceae bacterium]|nr:amidohydrolase family protein [Bryobacteraceae bacterium]
MKAYIAQIRMNLRLTFRDRSVLFFNYIFPLIFFFIFGTLMHAERGGAVVQIVNMSLSLGVLASGLFGAGMRTVMDREQNILRRFKVAPISPGPLLVAQLVTGMVHFIPVTFVTLLLARVVYGMAPLEHPISLYVFVLVGLTAFRAIGSIVGAVANSMQESQIIVQLLYFPLLFLGGATFPLSVMPNWLQTVAQFIPSRYLSEGLIGILQGNETLFDNLSNVAVLLATTFIGTFLALKLFRWEKEEKMRASAKLWIAVVLTPFLLAGSWQLHAKDSMVKQKALSRQMRRDHSLLIRDARLFLGDGTVIEQGAVLVRHGKIAEIYTGSAPDPKSLKAEPVDAAGKTLLPGLIDVHIHLGASGGFWEKATDYSDIDKSIDRELAAYLYSGVTAVKSVGDPLDSVLQHRAELRSGEKLGAELFAVGPMFTAPGGHGTEYAKYVPEAVRAAFQEQIVRLPKTVDEARQQVDELKKRGVDGIKTILEPGAPSHPIPRLDITLLRAIAGQARADNLPIVSHVGDRRDVSDALDAGVNGIEHDPRDGMTAELLARMKEAGVTFDPTLAVMEAIIATGEGKTDLLDRSMVQQAAPPRLLAATKKMIASQELESMRAAFRVFPFHLETGKQSLAAAYRAGVMLVTGTDSGNPQMIHGPGIHRELQLWVEAGVPPEAALRAATYNGAKLLRVDDRMGLIRKGYEANLLLVDGNPLKDISATERISTVVFKGELLDRTDLFDQP